MPGYGYGYGNPFYRKKFLAETNLLLTTATSKGYTLPSANCQKLINTFIDYLIKNGIWAKMDNLYVLATDGDLNFATLNWKNPNAYQLLRFNNPTFTSKKGYAGDGVSAYLSTQFNPSVANGLGANISKDDVNVTCYMDTVNDSSGVQKFFFGALNMYNLTLGEDNGPGNMRPDVNGNNSGVSAISKTGAKWFSMNRDAAANHKFIQETTMTTTTKASVGLADATMTLLGRSGTTLCTDRRMSLFSMGKNLVTENAGYRTAWYNYFNNL